MEMPGIKDEKSSGIFKTLMEERQKIGGQTDGL